MQSEAALKKKRGISPLWILPIIALSICGWLLYRSYMEAGVEIVVYFDDVTGLTPAKTQVIAKGLPIGVLRKLVPDIEQQRVKAIIKIDRLVESYLVEGTQFWIVQPEISASRVSGLETMLSGVYIGAQGGESTIPAREFTARTTPPPAPADAPGLWVTLKTPALNSIQRGSIIYYRNIDIGSVQSYSLDSDNSILIECLIKPDYAHLVLTGSRFYNASGLNISGRFPDVKLHMESVASLLSGGIVVFTPEQLRDTPPAKNRATFTLHEDFDAADYGLPMTLKLASGAGINEGTTKVMYRGLTAGYVKRVTINEDVQRSVTANIMLDPRAEIILRQNTRFWMVSTSVSVRGVEHLDALLTGPYITFQPGDGPFRDHFEILTQPPAKAPLRPGKEITLVARDAWPDFGAPIYYRKVQIGEIIGFDLAADRSTVEIKAFIYQEYEDLIRSDSVFIKAGGVHLKASLKGVEFDTEPLITAIAGGAYVVNPPGSEPADQATPTQRFPLYTHYSEAQRAVKALRPRGLYIELSGDDVSASQVGNPILFKNMHIGQVIDFTFPAGADSGRLSCFIEREYEHLLSNRSRFYEAGGVRVSANLSGFSVETKSLEALLTGGIGIFTPEGGEPVKQGHRFTLHESLTAAREVDNSEIEVSFQHAHNLSVGAAVKYRGIQIGAVSAIGFGSDYQTTVASLSIDPPHQTLFKTDTLIWLGEPVINLSGIKHAEAIVFGPSVALRPGQGTPRYQFIALTEPPKPLLEEVDGLQIMLEAPQLGSLEIGSPIFYRRVQVGRVAGYDLAADFSGVLIFAEIKKRYAAIVRQNTRFWNASGISVEGGLFSGITVNTQSMEAVLSGGIALATPGNEEMGPPAATGARFTLYDKAEKGWLDWSPTIFTIEEEAGRLTGR